MDDEAAAVPAAGVCVNARFAGLVSGSDHAQVGVGLLGLVAVMVNELPAVMVCAWIGLIDGAGAAWTVIVVDAVVAPHGLSAIIDRKYWPGARPVALNVGVVVVAPVSAPFRSVPPAVVPAVHCTVRGSVAFGVTEPDSFSEPPFATAYGAPLIVGVAQTKAGAGTFDGQGL